MTLKLFENILRMINKETFSKTEQVVVSPGHKPNNEQLNLCSNIFSCFVIKFNKRPASNKRPPRISAHPEGPKIK